MGKEHSRRVDGYDKLDDALRRLEEIDRRKHLHTWGAVTLFAVSAGLAVYSFFWLIDLAEWLGLSAVDPLLSVSVCFALLFVVWVCYYSGSFVIKYIKRSVGRSIVSMLVE